MGLDVADLSGVSETMLWTLYCRASEARRPEPVLVDPLAIELLNRIDYDFSRFEQTATPRTLPQAMRPTAQYFAARAASFDRVIRDFVSAHPDGTVVALAEGLQTTYWRIGSPPVRWVSLDLPAVVALREKLLPASPHLTHVAASALDPSWFEVVGTDRPTLVTAEGLLMYLQPSQARDLIGACAQHFPGGSMVFDMAPPPAGRGTWQWTPRYQVPPMHFTLSSGTARAFAAAIPGVESAQTVPFVRGRGFRGRLQAAMPHYPVLSYVSSSITRVRFD